MTDIVDLITEYLSIGGLFNPEAMEHDKVRNMVIQAREEIQSLRGELAIWKSAVPDIAPENVLPDRAALEAENAKLRSDMAKVYELALEAAKEISGIKAELGRRIKP